MALSDLVGAVRSLRGWVPVRRRAWAVGTTEVAHARLLADAERATGEVPAGCAWLDERTVGDVDLPLVFRTLDRTATPTGAQALWRWLVAPAIRLDVLEARERSLARLADPARRARVRDAIGGQASSDAPHLPRLLWEPLPPPLRTGALGALAAALLGLGVLAAWWPLLVIACVALLVANVLIDDWVSLRFAPHSRALEVLGQVIGAAERVVARGAWADAAIAGDVAVCARLRKQLAWLTVRDQLGLADLLRGGLLLRLLMLGRWMRVIERERDRLRRVVRWVGELDALVSIATLRAERGDARLPRLATGAARIAARDLVHPAIAGAIGNDLALDGGLLLTGSNASGKSTFLRAIAINAICAQSIHTTFGDWDASLFRVFAVMRIADVTAEGTSTYAVEVAAVGALVDAVRAGELPALFAIDEPFRGTNPALRVPIVVSVLDYLGARDLVIAATHDLEVAAQVEPRFARGYFGEPDDATGRFDRKLRPGIAPTSNALALLIRAGYPRAIIAAVEQRVPAGRA
jgi:MutS domain V